MRKAILSSLCVLLMVVMAGCSGKAEEVSIQDLLDDKVEEGTKVIVSGTVIFVGSINTDSAAIELEDPAQVAPLADDETGRTVKTYNEVDITEHEFEEGEEITVEAIYKGKDDDFTIIQAEKIEKR